MSFLSSIFSSLFGSTEAFTNDAVQTQLTGFRTLLNNGTNAIVRFWVEAGASYGHQSATANLVYRMARPVGADNLNFGYTGTIEIYYERADDLPKLQQLIPELLLHPPRINAATVQAILWAAAPGATVNFGFSGGAQSTPDYLTKFNVRNFLLLQPYQWTRADEVIQRTGVPAVKLSTVAQLGAAFANRLFYIDPTLYQNPPFADFPGNVSVEIVEEICQNRLAAFQFLPIYSLKTPISRLNDTPIWGAALICGSAMAWQRQGAKAYRNAKPVIILSFDDFGTAAASEEAGLREILQGRTALTENGLRVSLAAPVPDPNLVANFARRSQYFTRENTNARLTYLNYPTTLLAVTTALDAIQAMAPATRSQQALFIQLGRVPQSVFNYSLYNATLPGLFEGQNTTNTAINMGVPYMQVPAPDKTVSQQMEIYPSVTLQGLNPDDVPLGLARVARQINSSNKVWPESASQAPCIIVGDYYRQYTDQGPTDSIFAYFTALQAHFAAANQDKFCLAVAYLNYLLTLPAPHLLLAAGADDNPLNALYDKLKDKEGQEINLVPDILSAESGAIAKFILNFLAKYSDVLSLTVKKLVPAGEPPNLTSITLEGPSTVFSKINVDCVLTVVFTAPDNQLTADITFTSDAEWSLEQAPWIVLSGPFVHILVPNGKLPIAASIGGYYPALESADPPITARLEISVNNESTWGASIGFEQNFPGISTAFQMATSLNLVQMLPPPFNVLADLGISNVDLQYDFKNKVLRSIAITAQSNTQNLKLFNTLALSNIKVATLVLAPTTTRELVVTASADFSIGPIGDPNSATISLSVAYPGFTLQGSLTQGTITLENLFSTFLPSGYQLSLPSAPSIDQFAFTYTPATDYLTISLNLNIDWTFSFFNKDLFKLENVGFGITRQKGANTGFITANTLLLPDSAKIGLSIGAFNQGAGNWSFEARQTSGVVDLNDLLKEYLGDNWIPPVTFPALDGLSLTLDWNGSKATSFEFTAKTASPWQPITVLPDVTVTGNAKIGYKMAPEAALVHSLAEDQPGAYGTLTADLTLWNVELAVTYDFNPKMKKLCVQWLSLKACLTTNKDGDTIAEFTLDNKSLGEMVEMFVSWATGAKFGLAAPWDLLNDISLNGFKVTYNFTKKTVSFTQQIGSIDFGLFKIDGIGLTYDSTKTEGKVQIEIKGSFVWEPEKDSLSWDATNPSSTPAPPGGGNKYLDLRMLALGQHVTVQGLTEQRQVQDVIKMLRDLQVPTPPEIPVGGAGQPILAPKNSWFVAFDFGVLKAEDAKERGQGSDSTALVLAGNGNGADKPAVYFIQLSIVFNDPTLYALQIALDGPMAKVFAGLNFQIMYRQVSDTVGCYSAQIALPNIMRTFQIGVASITLPVFGIEVYTNGDFQVDIGFPWQMDFSRSFTIQVIVPPGIPVLGSAGFYFGKLSSATTDLVPKATNGWFNPVLVFGFGAQLGLGKSIEAGILSAGFSITVFGIIEGVIARWLPYTLPTPPGQPGSLQDGYYFSLTGTFGLQGRLYGSINFAIIKATVDVSISMYIRFVFTSYEDILIGAAASVRISVSVEINLGLFSISISFSFSASISVSFTLQNPMGGNPPWQLPGQSSSALLMHQRRLERVSARLQLLGAAADYQPNWSNLTPGTPVGLTGWVAPVLTVAGDLAATPADQLICYAVNFFLPIPPPVEKAPKAAKTLLSRSVNAVGADEIAHAALARARKRSDSRLLASASGSSGAGDSFEDLAIRVVLWVIAAGLEGSFTPDEAGNQIVTTDFLQSALDYLSGQANPVPIPAAAIETFMQQQAQLVFNIASGEGQASGAFFPAPPGTVLEVPQYPPAGGDPLFKYAFGDYNGSSGDYLQKLNDYFNELLVQVEEQSNAQQVRLVASGATGPSVASFTFSDYFTLLGRQGIQALLDGLSNFKLVIDPGKTVQGIVDWINATGNRPGESKALTSAPELFKANENHALSTAASRPLTIAGMSWQSAGNQSFNGIAALSIFNQGFDGKALATLNSGDSRILAAGVAVNYPGQPPYTTGSGDSLDFIAAHFGVALPELLSNSDVLANAALVIPLAVLGIPNFSYPVSAGDTLSLIGGRFGVTQDALAGANLDVSSLFDSASDPNLNVPELSQFQVDALIDEAERTLALQNLAAMTSRFYLSGLRLPTQGLTPNYPGLFVSGGPGSYQYPAELGLFALTGQVFPLPNIASVDPAFNFSLTRGSSETWLSLGAPGGASVTFNLNSADDLARYQSLKAAAQSGRFESGMSALAPVEAASTQPGRYPLANRLAWQTTVPVLLPQEAAAPTNPQPSIWQLPDPLINLPGSSDVLPRFRPVLARTDAATGNTREQAANNFGFGTLISFSLRRTAAASGAAASSRFYELIGASQSDTLLLERLLDRLGSDDSSFQQMVLLYPPASTGSDASGWQSDDQSASLMGIAQVNLSTETHPPSGLQLSTRAELLAAAPLPNVINAPTEFLRLLWEASITRSGGFYLSYTTGIGGGQLAGLPDRIFSNGDVAQVAVLSLFKIDAPQSAGEAVPASQGVAEYMNAVATNEPLDLSDAAFIAEAVEVAVETRLTTTTDTLASLAAAYYTEISVLVQMNSTAPLSGSVTVAGGRYEVPPGNIAPGGDLNAIAAYFNTTAQAIQNANPHRTSWPNPLPAYTGLILPPIAVNIGVGPGGNTCASLSAYYNAPIPAIAAANAGVPGFFAAGQSLHALAGPITLSPLLQAGVAGFTATRTAPAPLPAPKDPNFNQWGSLYLQHMYNLLGYRVAENPDFRLSAWGLPASPVLPQAAPADDRIQAPAAAAPGDEWIYTRTLPYPSLIQNPPQALAADLPLPSESPYLGVGGLLQFDLAWQDIFGNRILSELTRPQSPADLPASPPSEIAGYTDSLIGLGQWPGVANAYRIVPDSNKQPSLELLLAFDQSQFTSSDAASRVEHAITVYKQVLFQLGDPNGVEIGLSTSVLPGAESLFSPANALALIAWVENIYQWLQSLLPGGIPVVLTPELTIAVPLDIAKLNQGQIFRVTAGVTISRNPYLVEGQLSTASGVSSISATLAPWTGPLTSSSVELGKYNQWRTFTGKLQPVAADPVQRDITAFSNAFTQAFASLKGVTLHIATGSDSNSFTSSARDNLWAVQLGDPLQSTAISYKIGNSGAPRQFAPRPISNQLVSRAGTQIISYETGKVISPSGAFTLRSFAGVDLDQWMQSTLTEIDALLTPRYVAPALILRQKSSGPDALQLLLDAKRALAGALKQAMVPVFKDETDVTQSQKDAIQEVFYQSMLGMLTGFYAVKAGIQFDSTVNAAIARNPGELKPPRLYGDVEMRAPVGNIDAGAAPPNNISLSSPKLNLAFAGSDPASHFLNMLLSSTTTAEGSVTLNLEYLCQYVEHEISTLPGIQGYEPSTWLSFADNPNDPGTPWPLNSILGQFEVPLVLRAFPATPTLVLQESAHPAPSDCYKPALGRNLPRLSLKAGDSCSEPGNYNPLASATTWNYGFTWSLPVHTLNDAIHGEIRFNNKVSRLLNQDVPARDLFDNLAEFATVFPAIQADLDNYLAPLDVGTSDPTQIGNAQTALESAAAISQWIADSAGALAAGLRLKSGIFNSAAPYLFTVSESSITITKDKVEIPDVLCVTVTLAVPPPTNVGSPIIQIQPDYTCHPYGQPDGQIFSFVYTNPAGDYLLASQAAKIAERTFVLPSLDILEHQNAEISVYLTRNEKLAGRKIADVFVYTTPTVSFADPLLPTLTNDQPIDLATINAIDPNTPVTRSLDCQLSELYQVLFENSGTDSVTLALTAYYQYSPSSQVPSVRLPVYLMPPTQVAVRAGGDGAKLAEIISEQAQGCENWYSSLQPSTLNAQLQFDLTVMSDLTQQPMPILHLSSLFVQLKNISPPLS